jgi:P-type E1-E2 ATPase
MITVVFIIAAVPEGLPIAVAISTAFSTGRMHNEKLLLKTSDALENAGSLTDIITGKTSTLTTGELEVRHLWLAGEYEFEDVKRPNCLAFKDM